MLRIGPGCRSGLAYSLLPDAGPFGELKLCAFAGVSPGVGSKNGDSTGQ